MPTTPKPKPPHPAPHPAPAPVALHALGPQGTFSHVAALEYLRLSQLGPLPIHLAHTLPEVVRLAAAHPDEWGVIPIENSVAGTVGPAQDSLLGHPVAIVAEVRVQVRFGLLTREAEVGGVHPGQAVRCYAHPQAAEQCSQYLATHLPQAEVIYTASNMASAQAFLGDGRADTAAIVPLEEAQRHPQWVSGQDIQDYPHNTTRFVVVRRHDPQAPTNLTHWDFTRQKTSLCLTPRQDRAGLLLAFLQVFVAHGINLLRLESRPTRSIAWANRFFIDLANAPATPACLAQLAALGADLDAELRVLGSYDVLA